MVRVRMLDTYIDTRYQISKDKFQLPNLNQITILLGLERRIDEKR